MVVVGTNESANPNETVAAGAILDHHRLTPPFGQAVRKETGRNVRCAGRTERHDELDRSRWIGLRPGDRRPRVHGYGSRPDFQELTAIAYHGVHLIRN